MSVSDSTNTVGKGPDRVLRCLLGVVLGLAALLVGSPARADITFYNVFKDQSYVQTSDAQPTTPTGFQGTVNVDASSPSDLTGATVTSSSPLSPMTLTGSNGDYAYPVVFATKAAMDAAFPNGTTYTFTINGGTFGGQTGTLSTPATDQYAAAVPYFTNNTYTTLQGVNAASTINLTFNPYTSSLNTPLTFIGITNVSTDQLVASVSGPNTLSSATFVANTLAPGTTYDLDIVYSNREVTAGPPGFGTSSAFYSYDLRTDLIFTTATSVPEPSTLILGVVGLALLLGVNVVRRWFSARSAVTVSTLPAEI
jgi:hypothetical protein